MALNEAVVHHDLCTVAELLETLTEDEAWRTADEHWVFRGQALQDWDLAPTAYRAGSDAFAALVKAPVCDIANEFQKEGYLLVAFAKACNEAGLELHRVDDVFACDAHFGESCTWGKLSFSAGEFPLPEFDRFLAVARHNGLPTRLLDWTRSPLMAAFFAVHQAFKMEPRFVPPQARISIWAADLKKIARASADWPSRVREVIVPTHGNFRLRAQAGLFTVVQGPNPPPLNRLVQANAVPVNNDMLHVFTLPWSELPALYRRLHLMGVTAATALPDYEGALDSLVLEARATTFLKQ